MRFKAYLRRGAPLVVLMLVAALAMPVHAARRAGRRRTRSGIPTFRSTRGLTTCSGG